jgi:hypothetical protein
MEPAFQMVMATQRLRPMLRSTQDAACLVRQSTYRGARRNVPASRRMVSDLAHRTPRNARHHAKQVPCLGVSMKRLRDGSDFPR